MRIYSLYKSAFGLNSLEVEVELVRGLPQLHILGRADAAIKECALRLKTAFQHQGWEWPRTQQIIVNLKPAHFKKESSGLDLAIALGIRQAQGLLPENFSATEALIVFGEVGLNGEVFAPQDLNYWHSSPTGVPLLTGKTEADLPFDFLEIESLGEWTSPRRRLAKPYSSWLKAPALPLLTLCESAAELAVLTAAGGHNVLLAGPSGTGKSTWAELLWSLLPPPDKEEFFRSRSFHLQRGQALRWRPYVQPHHTASAIALIGGGIPPRPGAFSLAHGGLLLLDEYLEFSPRVQEALREPLEKACIHLYRGSHNVRLPSRFQLIATSNLCPCGKYAPDLPARCSYSLRKCRSHLERLSGPVIDRFDLLNFTSDWSQQARDQKPQDLKDKVSKAIEYRESRGQTKPNAFLSMQELEMHFPSGRNGLLPEFGNSHRRKRALLRVARTLADMDQMQSIEAVHIRKSMEYTWKPFHQLEAW